MDVQPHRKAVWHRPHRDPECSGGGDREIELGAMTALGLAPATVCVFSYLPHQAWKEQLPASGRPGGSRLWLVVLGEEDPGTTTEGSGLVLGVVDA